MSLVSYQPQPKSTPETRKHGGTEKKVAINANVFLRVQKADHRGHGGKGRSQRKIEIQKTVISQIVVLLRFEK